MMITVLYEDNHLIAVNKPHGQPVQGDDSGDLSLFDEVKAFLKERDHKPGNVFLGLLHRLDRPVGGVVLFAKTSKAAARLSDQFRRHSLEKVYWAIGEVRDSKILGRDEGVIEQWLVKNEQTNIVTAYAQETVGAQHAHTIWKKMSPYLASGVFYELRPTTGRSHQLRVALAHSLHTPIVGDVKYGAREALANGRAIALFARSLTFLHPISQMSITVVAEPSLDIFRQLE